MKKFLSLALALIMMFSIVLPVSATDSEAATLEITEHPNRYNGYIGNNAQFGVIVNGEGLSYQWYWSGDNGATWTACIDGNHAMLTVAIQAELDGYL